MAPRVLVSILTVLALAGPAAAEPSLILGPGEVAQEGSSWEAPAEDVGSPIRYFGDVADHGGWFEGLSLPEDLVQLSYSFQEMTLDGVSIADTFEDCAWTIQAIESGVLRVVADTEADWPIQHCPPLYEDGIVLLEFLVDELIIADGGRASCDYASGELSLVGGQWWQESGLHEWGSIPAVFTGEIHREDPVSDGYICEDPGQGELGPFFRISGAIEIIGPTPMAPTTWSGVKARYR